MIPNATKLAYFDGQINLGTATIRAALYNTNVAYTPNPDTDAYVADVLDGTTAEEFSDTNYSRMDVPNPLTRQDDTVDQAQYDADDLVWESLGGTQTIQGVVLYIQSGADDSTPADDRILRVIDETDAANLPMATNGSNVTIAWDASGIVTMA